jgi:hypothetical protein
MGDVRNHNNTKTLILNNYFMVTGGVLGSLTLDTVKAWYFSRHRRSTTTAPFPKTGLLVATLVSFKLIVLDRSVAPL